MPHQCTTCGRTFPDGSKEMLGGCPDCGGNKFQFAPSLDSRSPERAESGDEPSGSGERASHPRRDATDQGGGRRERTHPSEWGGDEDRQWPETGRRPEDRSAEGSQDRPDRSAANGSSTNPDTIDSEDADPTSGGTANADHEDTAQATARSDVVSTDELPAADAVDRPDPEGGRVVSEPTDDQPSLEELREELNQQFESIKIVNPGQYELNLMELYNRDEYIISLQEDGRYVIDVPDSWRESEE